MMSEENVVKGIVLDDKSNTALIGANIIIKGTEYGSATNNEGKFSISGLPAGRYTLIASYIGYETIEIELIKSPGQSSLDIIIKLISNYGQR